MYKLNIILRLLIVILVIHPLYPQEINTDTTDGISEEIPEISGTQNEVYSNFPHYDLNLTVNPENGTIEGNVSLDITWTENMNSGENSICIGLFLNRNEDKNPYIFSFLEQEGPDGFSPSNAEISDVSVNSVPAECKYREHARPIQIKYNTEHIFS